jgi:hypothetical protein
MNFSEARIAAKRDLYGPTLHRNSYYDRNGWFCDGSKVARFCALISR